MLMMKQNSVLHTSPVIMSYMTDVFYQLCKALGIVLLVCSELFICCNLYLQ